MNFAYTIAVVGAGKRSWLATYIFAKVKKGGNKVPEMDKIDKRKGGKK